MLLNYAVQTVVLTQSNNHVYDILGIYDGYPTFVISILFIGACTAVIGDVAGHLGCFINLKDGVNAIAFVALGTSVPGTAIVCAGEQKLLLLLKTHEYVAILKVFLQKQQILFLYRVFL